MITYMLKNNIKWLKLHSKDNPQNDKFWLCKKYGNDIILKEIFIRIKDDFNKSLHKLIFAWCPECDEPREVPEDYTTFSHFELQSA